ncbi:speckle targeted PIP5K1A-regulated poly(A) polymerase-like [Coccinella septempunctata]|uniref:speckle targeted PIP5K1A-regulated poly(A) polymerase-like n=1 Tax=Coccinella septempunctata TaxID=41139 RepID=UPI001D095B45|nr:speckle targeted PIP5K1A-regulated poly(A) polymerase-like [Coccinella septempunctata]
MEVKSLKCDLCKKQFSHDREAFDHFKSKKHLKLVEQHADVKCGVYITGFSYNQTKEDALQYFSDYGGIRKSLVGPTMSYMIIVYEKEEEAAKVLSCHHILHGRRLRVEKRLPPATFDHTDNDDDTHQKLLQTLKTIEGFDNQISRFVHLMTPDLRNISKTYELVNKDIFEALSSFFSVFCIFNFGSSTTFLQFNSSDLDVYVDIIDRPENDKKCLKMIRSALARSKVFYNVIDIPSAKIPIVKCTHNQTGMKCDINFKNMLGVENSKLIRYYLSLDHRLRNILLVIKYWAKIQEISGRNHLFTSYSMVMMFIFYLQECHSFPSVYVLQRNTVPNNSRVIWNMNINPVSDIAASHQIKNVSMFEILSGFFRYYSTFKFDSQIICPYLGRTIDKQRFSEVSMIPEEFRIYVMNIDFIEPLKYDKPVCLQDPFELNVNTCNIIFKNILDRFVAACLSAVQTLSNEKGDKVINLFSVGALNADTPSKKKKKYEDDPSSYKFCLKQPNLSNVPMDSETNTSEMWFQHTIDYCCTVFEKVLKLDMNETYNHKRARIGEQNHIDNDVKTFHALAFVNMWDSRNVNPVTLKDELDNCTTTLEREIKLSDHIWEGNAKIRPTIPLFECNITFTCTKDPMTVQIELFRVKSYKKIYKAFALYVTKKIPQWFLVHVKEEKSRDGTKLPEVVIVSD